MHFQFTQADACWMNANIVSEDQKVILSDLLDYYETINVRGFPEKVTASFLNKQIRGMRIPTGLVPYVHGCLTRAGHTVKVTANDFWMPHALIPELPGVTFEPYQLKIFRKIGNLRRGIIVGPTGSGKTVVAGGLIAAFFKVPTLVVVPTKDIFRQTIEAFQGWFGKSEIGWVGEGSTKINYLMVAMYHSLRKYNLAKLNEIMAMVIVDEAHGVHKSIYTILSQLTKIYYRFGLTATPQEIEENRVKFLRMMGMLGPVFVDISDAEATSRVTGVDVWMIVHHDPNPEGWNYMETYRKGILLNPERNTKIVKVAGRSVAKGNNTLILVDETEQALMMQDIAQGLGIEMQVAHGELDSLALKRIKTQFNAGKIKLVVATPVFGVGTNIPNIDVVMLGSARKSKINTLQKIGRGRRRVPGKEKLTVIDVWDEVNDGKKGHFIGYSQKRRKYYEEKGWWRGFYPDPD